jgi:predicted nucleic acid-binding Zn ribbon protein
MDENYAAHGPEFTGIYLYLVHEFLGSEIYDELAAAFEANKVKVHHRERHAQRAATEPEDLRVSVTLTETRRCAVCGMTLSTRTRFCSDKCRWTFHNRRRHERTAAEREKVCGACGKEFTATRADAKTCSDRCRKRLQRL